MTGGEKYNSIPPRSETVIMVDENEAEDITNELEKSIDAIKAEYSVTDADMRINVCNQGVGSRNVLDVHAAL